MALFLSVFFLFTGCGGEDKPYEQICDITSKTGGKPRITGLCESGENDTETVIITDFQVYENVREQLITGNIVELPKIKEKKFEEDVILVIVRTLSDIRDYEYQVKEVSADQGTLFVKSELSQDTKQWGSPQECYQVALVRLDKELVQDVQKVSVKTERVDKTF